MLDNDSESESCYRKNDEHRYASGLTFANKVTPEPIFGSFCLCDVRSQRQVSEMFHFDLTSEEAARAMLLDNAGVSRHP